MNLPDIPGLFASLELLQPYRSERKALAVRRGCLTAHSKDEIAQEEVFGAIESFADGQAEGWVCFAQKLRVGMSHTSLSRDLGLLLSAEFVQRTPPDSGPVSLHVRHLGDKWRLTTVTRTNDEHGFLVPHRFLRVPGTATAGIGTPYLKYEVFWTSPDSTKPLQATLSRFIGFGNY